MAGTALLWGGPHHQKLVVIDEFSARCRVYRVVQAVGRNRKYVNYFATPSSTLPDSIEYKEAHYVPVPLVVWMEKDMAKRRGLIR